MPLRLRTRRVAALKFGVRACCAQPTRNATRPRRTPRAGVKAALGCMAGTDSGSRSSGLRSAAGSTGASGLANCPRRAATLNTFGAGRIFRIAARLARSSGLR